MTSLVATASISVVDDINPVKEINCHKYRQRRHVLKSKENTIRHRCDKVLKRKLRKYKLRQDGKEDQDILDVSKILVSSLIIRSPNNQKDPYLCEDSELDDWRPKNYLFKMVRRKPVKISETLKNSNTEVNVQDDVTRDSPSAVTSQEKKQTNAFKLLMDSRNKSLGCNSPGKDKSDENIDTTEVIERKNLKAKRQLVLQKMAEAKGSLKNKEIEEFQDTIIKEQMEKRAKRLKNMIFKDTKSDKEGKSSNGKLKKDEIIDLSLEDKAKVTDNNNTKKQTKSNTFKIVDIFNTVEDNKIISPVKKHISKEDEDFLNKLSPSLKKKESMLSYFKKIDKDTECSTNSENDNLIKVKLQPRNKKKSKKKKLSLKKDGLEVCDLTETIKEQEENINGEIIELLVDNSTNGKQANNKVNETAIKTEQKSEDKTLASISVNIPDLTTDKMTLNLNGDSVKVKNDSQKRKRNSQLDTKLDSENTNITCTSESRPKRSVKRPVKYVDDACLSSSDDELHIFTPKKKKHIESKNDKKPVCLKTDPPLDELKPVKPKAEKKLEKVLKDVTSKKPTKLAPIFTSKQTDPAALEAKQKFLQSGVPDKLKKQMQQQKVCSIPDNSFPVVVHVQQRTAIVEDNQLVINIPLMITETEEDYTLSYENNKMQKLLNLNQDHSCRSVDTTSKKSTQAMLQSIKKLHPKFPVYRTYRYLRSKGKGEFKDCSYVDIDNSIEVLGDMVDVINDSPDRLNWTDKYKAITTKQIIGNFEPLKELRKWLVSWTENQIKSKAKSKTNSDSSDYYESEPDSRDSMKSTNNLLILAGPTGCGKTASIYAVAADLAMKVIEVNASSRRTGKIMLQDLQEATQSHKVNRGTGNSDNSQKSQEKQTDIPKQTKKRGRPKKAIEEEKSKASVVKNEVLSGTTLSQESTRTDSSLILIDDADIVFDQDDGFTSAIVQLVHSSKRPVILITSSLVCPHLQRFVQNAKILKMSPLLPRILGTWLDIMCLADSGMCWPGVGAKFLNYFKGDIRKTINYLQFCLPKVQSVASEEEAASQNVDFYKNHIDEESSCMSWADNDDTEGRTSAGIDVDVNTIWTAFASKHSNLLDVTYPVQVFNMWWSMPFLLTAPTDLPSQKCNISHKKKASLELEAIANAADAFSLSDYYSHMNPDTDRNITSQPWYCPESHSVSERENPGYYHKDHEVMSDICHTILTGSIAAAQDVLSCDRKTNISFPGMHLNRQRDRVVSRHNSLTSYLNASAVLDRRALALDYWSSCRTICRLEKSKNDTNMKRNNRFCHYLKSLSVLCKSDTFDNLCDSLYSNEGTELNINNFNE